ncbi:DUF881 domain-containing protein [Ornithinimicrobium humiphilum]|uniref:Uncharacterized protein YlxW (UPF0749 family) n=1 Tax=Ornithinimicrobium humiphilum TaxID=125288 RepID=A0A543KJG8_9MICO|nr:DUF881 domain-containing protein [Ornithinimicrobium humiphilum]TQM95231.1 uncharacterized protein YlxW (UPF0749 family) [Ornithinimicrobium humiphilum]
MTVTPARDDAGSPAPAPRRSRSLGVTVVCILAGLLFGTSASLAGGRTSTGGATDLVSLITTRDEQVRELNEEAEALRAEVDALQQRVDTSETRELTRAADAVAPAVGTAPVTGPAVRVTLDDAGYTLDTLPEGFSVDDVVVHQQDLQGVVNALWAGGAEAIMVQDQRIVSTSAVQCVGSTLFLQGRVYSPPYTVTAVGDPASLLAALEADPVVSTYRGWAEAIGLGYAVEQLEEAELPAFTGVFRARYARVADIEPGESPMPDAG